jgi:hypothetical protein
VQIHQQFPVALQVLVALGNDLIGKISSTRSQ